MDLSRIMDILPSFEVEEELKKKLKDNDCGMSTMLQAAAMTKGEINFHNAAKENDLPAIEKLLTDRVDINCKNNLDRTALHWAAANGNTSIIEKLIEGGADLEAKDKYGMRPVLWSAWFGHLDALKLLINSGATAKCSNKQGMCLLHCASQNNNVNVINFVLESLENVNVNEMEKVGERTALHLAAEAGHLETVMRLIDMQADVNKRDKAGETALHLAARHGHVEVIKRLLMVGVEINDRDVDGRTALHISAERGHSDVVEVLVEYNVGCNAETIKEFTPLHLAATHGHYDVAKTLIEHGANVNAQNFQGNTALHLAATGNYKEVAQLIVESNAQIDLANLRFQTSLHVAVENGFQDTVEVLLAGGASLHAKEKLGKTPLQLASRGSFVAIVDMVIKAERYYAVARDYHEKELDYVDPHRYLRQPIHPSSIQMKDILWRLATKQLKPGDWKKLAIQWKFTAEHVRAIEHQYTGTSSYKEHGFRLMMIWLHGVRKDENIMKLLFESLVAIDRRLLAEQIRRRADYGHDKFCMGNVCNIA
ncbi:ankyrin repeat and death domain-containing protein 1A-like [Ylistrum balloti]|uniref:ankyrin repeat and death domain-containing protein 1A-like n=1 Tax=Ylistrum balloti TaxID=509963 RepID=UPI0029058149|nr:ankyrin repeat and death domain-containing protein 1A-like [Ylistrum balloti]